MKLPGLLKNKDALELIKKILSETALGNSLAFVLATLAKNSLSVSGFKYLLCLVFAGSAGLVLLWMLSLLTIYFSELEKLIGRKGTLIMIIWALTFELVLVANLLNFIPDLNKTGLSSQVTLHPEHQGKTHGQDRRDASQTPS